jgi:phosphoribosyl 1,2-cyclic phosphodiesterase
VAIVDLMMPGMDGAELCRRLRGRAELEALKIIVLSAKIYAADRNTSLSAGANSYAVKPIRIGQLLELIDHVVSDQVAVQFWGVRGTLPAPSPQNVRYGGNTTCVLLNFPRGQQFVLDAGSGIRELGNHLLKNARGRRCSGALFITHPHWDHINALPFFSPLYVPGNEWEICGPAQPGASVRDLVAAQMDGRFFPITPGEFGGSVCYTDLYQDRYRIQNVDVSTMLLMHPGVCLGYRFSYGGRTLTFVTDNELYLPGNAELHGEEYMDRLAEFVEGSDLLITDTTYTDEEYPARVGWGHSCVSQVARLAHKARVKRLCIFHHDPAQSDDDIDRKLLSTQEALSRMGGAVEAIAPREREELQL